jgi:hypothetical protein
MVPQNVTCFRNLCHSGPQLASDRSAHAGPQLAPGSPREARDARVDPCGARGRVWGAGACVRGVGETNSPAPPTACARASTTPKPPSHPQAPQYPLVSTHGARGHGWVRASTLWAGAPPLPRARPRYRDGGARCRLIPRGREGARGGRRCGVYLKALQSRATEFRGRLQRQLHTGEGCSLRWQSPEAKDPT